LYLAILYLILKLHYQIHIVYPYHPVFLNHLQV
jgi:hypothetical protein